MRSIMVMGTASSVGKSTFCLGLLRHLSNHGASCAPFKSLNVTDRIHMASDGVMSRGQALQCEAARFTPTWRCNPIVMSFGKSPRLVANGADLPPTAGAYRERRAPLKNDVVNAFRTLSAQVDCIVIEGAGSPVELNLLPDDYVNTGMAAIADTSVVLVGDIRGGGVFASLLGTLHLMPPEDRARVKGLIVNRFIGDPAHFTAGVHILEARSGVPVLGVIPETAIDLEAEDTLSPDGSELSASSLAYREEQYNRLAAHIAAHVDIKTIMEAMR